MIGKTQNASFLVHSMGVKHKHGQENLKARVGQDWKNAMSDRTSLTRVNTEHYTKKNTKVPRKFWMGVPRVGPHGASQLWYGFANRFLLLAWRFSHSQVRRELRRSIVKLRKPLMVFPATVRIKKGRKITGKNSKALHLHMNWSRINNAMKRDIVGTSCAGYPDLQVSKLRPLKDAAHPPLKKLPSTPTLIDRNTKFLFF